MNAILDTYTIRQVLSGDVLPNNLSYQAKELGEKRVSASSFVVVNE
jgi:hypothetical protein